MCYSVLLCVDERFVMATAKALTAQRNDVLSSVFNIVTELEALDVENDKFLILAKGKRLESLHVQWDKIRSDMIEYNSSHSSKAAIELEGNDSNRYCRLMDLGNSIVMAVEYEMQAPVRPVVKPEATEASSIVRPNLRPIDIPKLNNDNYELFISVFDGLVHDNRSLENVMKFHYLVNALDDNAKAIIANFLPISDANYVLAREALKEAYSNPRRTSARHVHTLLEVSNVPADHTPADLASLVNSCKTSIAALKSNPDLDLGDFLCFELIYSKLDKQLRIDFEKSLDQPRAVPKVDTLVTFLQGAVQASELNQIASNCSGPDIDKEPPKKKGEQPSSRRTSLLVDSKTKKCFCCDKCDHYISQCDAFKAMSLNNRNQFVRENNLCFKCLRKHPAFDCTSKYACKKCSSTDHNTLLCKQTDRNIDTNGNDSQMSEFQVNLAVNEGQQALLATALVYVKNSRGGHTVLRAVLDNGSQLNLITDRAAQVLGCRKIEDSTTVGGISGSKTSLGRVKLDISSRVTNYCTTINALIFSSISGDLPSAPVPDNLINETSSLPVADPRWGVPASVDLLLGAQVYANIIAVTDLPNKSITDNLYAQYTKFGYALMGSVSGASNSILTSLFAVPLAPRTDGLNAAVNHSIPRDILKCEGHSVVNNSDINFVSCNENVLPVPIRSDVVLPAQKFYSAKCCSNDNLHVSLSHIGSKLPRCSFPILDHVESPRLFKNCPATLLTRDTFVSPVAYSPTPWAPFAMCYVNSGHNSYSFLGNY